MGQLENSYSQTIENILEAMSEITSAQARSLSFDKTIKAVITDVSQASRGIYQVAQIGAEKTNTFTAHSDNTSYQRSDCVYVTVPEGDMTSGNKIILGKYVDDSESYYNYVNPMDGYLDITGNLIDQITDIKLELTANYADNNEDRIIVWSAENLALRGYDRLALKGEFKTWLQSSDINSGTYGLVLIIQDSAGKFTTYKLSSKEMYGNPYYFETFYSQNILVNIGGIEEIQSMHLAFIQENDFYKSDGERALGVDDTGARAPSNIFLKAPYVSVGYDVTQFSGDDVRIFTEDEQIFDSTEPSVQKTIQANWIHAAEGRSATVVSDFIEMPRNPDYDATTAGTATFPTPETKADLMWFEYDTEYSGTHFAAGQGWVEDVNALNDFTYSFYTPTGRETEGEANNLPYVKYKAIIMTPSIRYVNSVFYNSEDYETMLEVKDQAHSEIHAECLNIFHEVMRGTKTYNDGKTLITDKYKGISSDDFSDFVTALNAYLTVRSEVQWYDSGELIFPNAGYSPAKYAEGSIANLRISVDPEHLKGTYLLYDDTGYLTDTTAANVERYCEALYETIAGVVNSETTSMEDIAYEVDANEIITWYIPLDSTMIARPVSGCEYDNRDTVNENYVIGPENDNGDASEKANIPAGRYFKICRVPQFDETTIDQELLLAEHHMFARQKFKIKDYYTQLETNNTIYCRITKGGKNWYASGITEFGVTGTNGTDSTFLLKMYETDFSGAKTEIETSALSLSTTYYQVNQDNSAVKLQGPIPGKIVLVPKLYDYNKQEKENYFSNSNVTYRFYPNEDDSDEKAPFKKSIQSDGSLVLYINGSHPNFNDDNDYYLVIEAEVAYKITYNFLKYTDTDDPEDPTYLSEENALLGKKIGDYVLDENGNKQPDIDPATNQPRTRDDYLKTYLPISIVKNKILVSTVATTTPDSSITEPPVIESFLKQVVGANKVIYDRNGSNAKYYKDPYKLYNEYLQEVSGVSWSAKIKAVDDAPAKDKATVASFYPIITPDNILQPLEMYMLSGTVANYSVIGRDDTGILCVQPVLIIQNKYGSSMLNKWDGSLTIDEKNGTILASMVGAGIKDENNTFSGVLMGEVSQAFKDNHNGLGLYGFHQSDQSFGFNIDGRAFIGKAGHGRIWFDGNNGTITSGTYSDGVSDKYKIIGTDDIRPQQGMEIDLDGSDNISSSIKMFGPIGGFVIDTKGIMTDVYGNSQSDEARRSLIFKLFTGAYKNRKNPDSSKGEYNDETKPYERGMIYFDNDGQYIQSTNYNGFYDTDKTIAPSGLNTQTTPPGWIEVGEDEPAHSPATSGMFIDLGNGWMDARNGIIGGWQLSERSLTTPKQEIILWAGNPTSSNDDEKHPYIRLGSVIEGVMQGNLWIADYQVLGATAAVSDVKTLSLGGGEFSLNGSGFYEAADTGKPVEKTLDAIVGHQSKLLDSNFSTEYLNSWSLIDDTATIDDKELGVVLETAKGDLTVTEKDSSGKVIKTDTYDRYVQIWRPNKNDTDIISTVGTESMPWNSVYASDGVFQHEKFRIYQKDGKGDEIEGWHLMATQEWVAKVILAAANQRMKDVNSLASTALSRAKKAISQIVGWAAAFNGAQFVSDSVKIERLNGTRLKYNLTTITAQVDSSTGGLTGEIKLTKDIVDEDFDAYDIIIGTSNTMTLHTYGVCSWDDTSSIAWAADKLAWGLSGHGHVATLGASNGALYCTVSKASYTTAADNLSIFTSSGVSVSESEGTVTVTVTVAGQDASDSFNMASTQFYKDAVEAAYNDGHGDGYAKGKKDAACSKYHENSTKQENGVTYKLQWVAQ